MASDTSEDMQLRCRCGQLRGVVKQVRRANRMICYCRDCQTFAWALEREDILDHHGGSSILQTTPAHVELHAGHDQLACLRLGPKGPLRWYAKCCNSPLANTLPKPTPPFVGLVSGCWDNELDEAGRDARLGPVKSRVNGPGNLAQDGSRAQIDRGPLGLLRAIKLLMFGWLRGEHRPTPFFDDAGQPVANPRVLTRDEREAARAKLPPPAPST